LEEIVLNFILLMLLFLLTHNASLFDGEWLLNCWLLCVLIRYAINLHADPEFR
jgi:hypothetical protein